MILEDILSGNLFDAVRGLIAQFHVDPATKANLEQNLAKIELDNKTKVFEIQAKLQSELAQISERDIESARRREIDTKDKLVSILASFVTLTFSFLVGLILFKAVPDQNKEVLYTALGTFGAAFISVVGYYFGSSHGSDKKTEIISKLASQ